jgi:hypothetical protein
VTSDEPNPPQLPPPERRSGCATAFMVLFGLALLFPGLCTALIGAGALTHDTDPGLFLLVVLGLALAFGGVMLIRAAIRGPR